MPLQVIFDNNVLIIPGAYSVIDFSALANPPTSALGIITVLTTSDVGDPTAVHTFTDYNSLQTYVGVNSPLYPLAPLIFNPSTDARIGSPNYVNVVLLNNSTRASHTGTFFSFTSNYYGPTGNYFYVNYNINTSSQISLSVTNTLTGNTNNYTINQVAGSISYSGSGNISIIKSGNNITINGSQYDATQIPLASFNQFLNGLTSTLSFSPSTNFIGNSVSTLDDFSTTINSSSPYSVYLNVWYLNNKFSDPYVSLTVNTSSLILSSPASNSFYLTGGYVHSVNGTSSNVITQNDVQRALGLIDKVYTNTLTITADGQNSVNMGYGLVYNDTVNLLSSLKAAVDNRNTLQESNYTSLFVGYNAQSFQDAVTFQQSMNDPAVTIAIQNIINPYDNNTYTPYALGVMLAALGAALPLGTSFTRKTINVLKAFFNFNYPLNRINKEALIKQGIQFLDQSSNGSWYIVKGNTSYTQQDNDGYTDTGTQLLSQYLLYDFDQYMSPLIGQDISSAPPSAPRIYPLVNPSVFTQYAIQKFEDWKSQGYITPITDSTGKIIVPAYTNLNVSIQNKVVNFSASLVLVSSVQFILSYIKALPYNIQG